MARPAPLGASGGLQAACAYAEAILVAVLLALFARAYLFEAFEIPSGSMERTLLVGDHIVVDKAAYAPHRGPWRLLLPYREVAPGDVVVFRSPVEPGKDLVKRAIGLPGDTIRLTGERLYRNGERLSEPYAVYDPRATPGGGPPGPADAWGPATIPQGTFLALGDNRDDSRDSRVFGPVPFGQVKGRALFVYWSREPGLRDRFTGRGAAVRRFLDGAVHFFDQTRWPRTFRPVR
jgi:signal peptidase I